MVKLMNYGNCLGDLTCKHDRVGETPELTQERNLKLDLLCKYFQSAGIECTWDCIQ